jgi:plastocyanin
MRPCGARRFETGAGAEEREESMRREIGFGIAIALLAFGLSATAGETMVHVGHNRLDPAELSIAVGDTVVFHNMDEMPGGHSIVADDGSFASPPLAKNESWSHTFSEPGTHPYHIKEHETAKGKIIVE